MPRVNSVKKARKDQRPCYKCRKEIKRGDSYRWFANRIGRASLRKNICDSCTIRPSDLTSSKLGQVWDAQDDARKAIAEATCANDLTEALTDLASVATDTAEEYRDSVANMPESLQYSPTAEDCNEKADNLDNFASELENWQAEDWDGEGEESLENEAYADWLESQRDSAYEAVDSLET